MEFIKNISLRDTIKLTVKHHLKKRKMIAMGQCLTAVGWVGGTLPELYEKDGMIELSMADVAGSGFAVGAALMGKRPIYIIRYQGFNWYNAPMIVNYACKSKEIWNKPCPLFIRSIAMEGGIGPVAGSSHHSIYYRMPGVKIFSPMTPKEYIKTYNDFMKDDSVYYVSEHRKSYDNKYNLKDIFYENPNIIFFAISIVRFDAIKASKILYSKYGIKAAVFNIFQIKPLKFNVKKFKDMISKKNKPKIVVFDDDYEKGLVQNIAYEISKIASLRVDSKGIQERSAGFHPKVDNLPPSCEDILKYTLKIIEK